MVRSLSAVVPLAFAVACAPGAAPAPVPPDAKKSALYFPTKVGAKWVRDNGDSEETLVVTAVEDKDGAKVVKVGRVGTNEATEHEETVVVSEKGLFLTHSGPAPLVFSPPLCLLKLPHKPGDKWEVNSKVKKGEIDHELTGVFKVHEPEEVKVPAGTFKAIRVEQEYTLRSTDVRATCWYAPGVGEVKMVAGKRTNVLKSFTLPKD